MGTAINWWLVMSSCDQYFCLYTIGYTAFSLDDFIKILQKKNIKAVIDVRSSPYSSRYSQYNRPIIEDTLKKNNIYYLFFGDVLGARPQNYSLYSDNIADFSKISKTKDFIDGCERINSGLKKMSICLMCAEKDPMTCHRSILISNRFRHIYPEIEIKHILESGIIEKQDHLDRRIMDKYDLLQENFFKSYNERRDEAYKKQEREIAYHISFSSSSEED